MGSFLRIAYQRRYSSGEYCHFFRQVSKGITRRAYSCDRAIFHFHVRLTRNVPRSLHAHERWRTSGALIRRCQEYLALRRAKEEFSARLFGTRNTRRNKITFRYRRVNACFLPAKARRIRLACPNVGRQDLKGYRKFGPFRPFLRFHLRKDRQDAGNVPCLGTTLMAQDPLTNRFRLITYYRHDRWRSSKGRRLRHCRCHCGALFTSTAMGNAMLHRQRT